MESYVGRGVDFKTADAVFSCVVNVERRKKNTRLLMHDERDTRFSCVRS